ncbi:MAG: hypothetical protein EBX52_09630 [Proteobacteria bacterium]|nr:hypothetical protein [Pseudomonadota bacterium]
MKANSVVYSRFVKWVQDDMNKARITVNRKVFSLVLWTLVIPALIAMMVYALRRFQIVPTARIVDSLLFLPPFAYAMVSLWPALRDIPRTFKIGGLGAMLEESDREVEWREETSSRLFREIPLTPAEWRLIEFHLEEDLDRMRAKNRYLAILAGAVLFFMFQFLDLGGTVDAPQERGPMGVFMVWADQFSLWAGQLSSILLFAALFYLSGIQLQKHLIRYQSCVKRLAKFAHSET